MTSLDAVPHISFRRLQYADFPSQVIVTVITDIPSHCWMRYTDEEPWKHPKSSFVRGLTLLDDLRFCFVKFNDLEQDEPGDTQAHTFTCTFWSYCHTYWFYLYGKVSADWSPSTSPIFSHHNIAQSTIPPYYFHWLEGWSWDLSGPVPYQIWFSDDWYWLGFPYADPPTMNLKHDEHWSSWT